MQKIILFYKFVPVKDPEAVRLWQRTLCEKYNLKGRILLADHGINGTLGGEVKDLKAYVKESKAYAPFNQLAYKWSEGSREHFPKLTVKVRPEIVTFGAPHKIKVNQMGIVGGGKKLKPRQVHELVKKHGEEVVFFDGRNAHEAAIGKFKNAVAPNVKFTRDFAEELQKPRYQKLKNKPIITYCTGGVRCEILSMLMIDEGFKNVYQLDGGIVKYGEEFGDGGLWEGALYVFDGRVSTKFSPHAKDIGSCSRCGAKTSNYINCADQACNALVLECQSCAAKNQYCSSHQPATAK